MLSEPIASMPLSKTASARMNQAQVSYTSEAQSKAIADLVDEFTLVPSTLKAIKDHFLKEMQKGLALEGQTVAMVPVFVSGRLDGSETGSYLTLDLGGTYLRVVSVVFLGQGRVETQQRKYTIEERLKVGEAKALFDFMASCIDSFMGEHRIVIPAGSYIELGFTFSFPVLQTAINSGTLIAWTKGFSSAGVVGKDPAALLQDALQRCGIPVRVAALLNDTVGTLLAHAYHHRSTVIGLGLGTGSNAAYIERADRITKRKESAAGAKDMVINMEFGAFDSERFILPLTMFDAKVDRKSLNPGRQIFEKMIAGMYLGEITRSVLLNLIDRRLLFNGNCTMEMNQVWAFDTTYMSTIEADQTKDLEGTRSILERYLGFSSAAAVDQTLDGSTDSTNNTDGATAGSTAIATMTDRQVVKVVVGLVGRRAARLSAAALAGILEHTRGVTWEEEEGVDIGVDGSLYRYYPGFESDMKDALGEIFKLETVNVDMNKVRMGECVDGSGMGAALCCLLAMAL